MNDVELIHKYFPSLSREQVEQFHLLKSLYNEWNSKVNLISRKDMDNLYEHIYYIPCLITYFVGPCLAALLWPLLTFVLLLPEHQPVDRDANRPL